MPGAAVHGKCLALVPAQVLPQVLYHRAEGPRPTSEVVGAVAQVAQLALAKATAFLQVSSHNRQGESRGNHVIIQSNSFGVSVMKVIANFLKHTLDKVPDLRSKEQK